MNDMGKIKPLAANTPCAEAVPGSEASMRQPGIAVPTLPTTDPPPPAPEKARATRRHAGRRRWPWAAAVVLLAAAGGGAWFWHQEQAAKTAQAPPPPSVAVPFVVAAARTIPVVREYVGVTRSPNTVDVRARATGYLMQRHFIEGADVHAGDVLYQVDPRDYQARLAQSQAQVSANEAALGIAKLETALYATLARDQFGSVQKSQQTQATQSQAQATLEQSRAQVQTDDLNLSYTVIRAPIDGRINDTALDVGGLISATDTKLTTLAQLDPIYASFSPGEADLGEINRFRAAGPLKATVTAQGDDAHPVEGVLDFVANAVDPQTGTLAMRATLPNPTKLLVPGQFIRVRLHLADRPGAVLVPQRAVGSDQGGKFVFVVGADGKAERRNVALGDTVGEQQVVENGVKAGEHVVTAGLQKLQPGMALNPELEKMQQ